MWVQQRDYVAFGALMSEARSRAGLSQKDLAGRLSKPQSFVSNLEAGQRRVDVLEFLRIAEALDTDAIELFRRFVRKRRT